MSDEARQWIDRYLEHLRYERRLSPHTLSNYARDLKQVHQYLSEQARPDWAALSNADVRLYVARRHHQGLSGRSLQRELSALRSFYRYLQREGLCRNNPALDVPAPKSEKRLPKTLDVDQTASLMTITGSDLLSLRDRAILELFYSCGLRLAELVSLDINDLDRGDALLRVTGKGNKTRLLPVGQFALDALQAWMKARQSIKGVDEKALFVSRGGQRISRRTVQARIKLWARRLQLPVEVHPHMLRHSFASHILESSGDLRAVQELLGHADISTTQVYTHLDFQHLAKVYDQAHPRAQRRKRDDGTD